MTKYKITLTEKQLRKEVDSMAKEYIDRDLLIHNMNKNPESEGNARAAQIIDCVLEAPAADVAPVVHGRWIMYNDGGTAGDCLVCGATWVDVENMKHCPDCGAKMDGGAEDG